MDTNEPRIRRNAIILLADDDAGDQELIRRALQQTDDRPDLYIANDGKEALDYLLRRGKYRDPISSPVPDLILLDLNMPRVNGYQVLAQISEHADIPRIPIIVLTTSDQPADTVRAFALGCSGFISKPSDIERFYTVIQGQWSHWRYLDPSSEALRIDLAHQ